MADTDPNDIPEQPEDAGAPSQEPESADAGESSDAQDLADQALKAAQDAVTGLDADKPQNGGATPVTMPNLSPGQLADQPGGIDLLSDVNLDVTIELGRTRMYVEDVLKLAEGAVVELDKLAGDPVDIYVNQRHVARGEVLILNDNFCVRVNEIVESQPEAAAG